MNIQKFNCDGFDCEGFDAEGFDANGLHRGGVLRRSDDAPDAPDVPTEEVFDDAEKATYLQQFNKWLADKQHKLIN